MQQAYRVLRVVAAAQTIRMVLMLRPNEIILSELYTACTTLNSESSRGIKAVVLDFQPGTTPASQEEATVADAVFQKACTAVQTIAAPVLAVVRGNLSETASTLVRITARLRRQPGAKPIRFSEGWLAQCPVRFKSLTGPR